MAKVDGRPTVGLELTLRMAEEEVAALDALMGYGVEPFLEVFYAKLGKAYLQPHEAGLRSLFSCYNNLSAWLARAQEARKVFSGTHEARARPPRDGGPPVEGDDALRLRVLRARMAADVIGGQPYQEYFTAAGADLDALAWKYGLKRAGAPVPAGLPLSVAS